MPSSHGSKQKWIEKGYEHFALYGPEHMSINKISKEIASPRASFYHHFGDMEIYIDFILAMHWEIATKYIDTAAQQCKKYMPDVYLLETYQIPLKFNRQLFLNRNIPKYNLLFVKTYQTSARGFMVKLFCEQFGLKNDENAYELRRIQP